MPQEYTLQEALWEAIHAKKNLRDFYRKAAEITENPAGRKVFVRLASEVEENIGKFFSHYRRGDLGDLRDFLAAPPHPDSVMLVELDRALDKDIHERRARELALREEADLEKTFRLTAARIIDPTARGVFLEVAEDARRHYAVIESEYAHTMGMVHETDIDTYVRE
ncbi:ferritin family protein [Desulfuromonas carbonis]|uniref:ferritin family protein n=1 Tax=Desulfuromonas sp. DDH964 TaxID=1823759 RepID=UPI00078EADDA|nr:ferritin family protein [Desulfuromonas sp. DDH964]AMV73837.1 ferritin-like domain-containing protein [Desulfuromonas sp. DDH964]